MPPLLELLRDSLYAIVFHLAPRLANVLLFVLIGRIAGPAEAGIFTLAATYLLIFLAVMVGLDDLLVRQVARQPDAAGDYFAGFVLLRLFLSLISFAIIYVLVHQVFAYQTATAGPIFVLSLSLVPESIATVAQAILMAQRRFAPPAVILASTSALKFIGGAAVILTGGTIVTVAWVWVIGSVVGMAFMLRFALRDILLLEVSGRRVWNLLRREQWRILSFLSLTALVTIETQSDTILLSGFLGETEVGWYGAATTVAYSLLMFSQAYRLAVYPLMIQVSSQSLTMLRQLYRDSVRFLALLVLPMIAGVLLLAPEIVDLVFGPAFAPTVPALRILILVLLFLFLNEPNVRLLLIGDRQQRLFVYLLSSAVANVLLNLLLIPKLGIEGAAIARVSSALLLFALCYRNVYRSQLGQSVFLPIARPLLATVLMLAVAYPIRGWSLALVVPISLFVYGAALLLTRTLSFAEIRRGYVLLSRGNAPLSQEL
jgi:O-antigen/teichoic acid export membrane protein